MIGEHTGAEQLKQTDNNAQEPFYVFLLRLHSFQQFQYPSFVLRVPRLKAQFDTRRMKFAINQSQDVPRCLTNAFSAFRGSARGNGPPMVQIKKPDGPRMRRRRQALQQTKNVGVARHDGFQITA